VSASFDTLFYRIYHFVTNTRLEDDLSFTQCPYFFENVFFAFLT